MCDIITFSVIVNILQLMLRKHMHTHTHTHTQTAAVACHCEQEGTVSIVHKREFTFYKLVQTVQY